MELAAEDDGVDEDVPHAEKVIAIIAAKDIARIDFEFLNIIFLLMQFKPYFYLTPVREKRHGLFQIVLVGFHHCVFAVFFLHAL